MRTSTAAALPLRTSPARLGAWRRRRWLGRLAMASLLLLVAFLFLWPVLMQLAGMFRSAAPGMPGTWTLDTVRETYGSRHTYAVLGNSLYYSATTTALATAMGALFAFLATRTTVRCRTWLTPVMLLVFAAPNLF